MYIKQNFGKKGSNIPPTTKKNIYNLPMTRPSLGLGPSWSPHFQSMPLTTRVPTRIIRANSIPLKGGGILLQRCKVSSKMAQIVATLLFDIKKEIKDIKYINFENINKKIYMYNLPI